MKRELRDAWTAALRSGEYRQGFGMLRQGRCEMKLYCCLGVLCEVLDPQGWEGNWHRGNSGTPSQAVREMAGLSSSACVDLAEMNDKRRKTFAQIADCIEENL